MAEHPTPRESANRSRRRLASLRRHALAIGMLIDDLEERDLERPAWAAGDVAQLRPDACAAWGGAVVCVTAVTAWGVRGYPLVPWRAGCLESWQTWPAASLEKLGALAHAQPRTAEYRRRWAQLPEPERRGDPGRPGARGGDR